MLIMCWMKIRILFLEIPSFGVSLKHAAARSGDAAGLKHAAERRRGTPWDAAAAGKRRALKYAAARHTTPRTKTHPME